jgi:hypothetical protein
MFGPVIKIQLTGGMGHTLSAEEGNMSTSQNAGCATYLVTFSHAA